MNNVTEDSLVTTALQRVVRVYGVPAPNMLFDDAPIIEFEGAGVWSVLGWLAERRYRATVQEMPNGGLTALRTEVVGLAPPRAWGRPSGSSMFA